MIESTLNMVIYKGISFRQRKEVKRIVIYNISYTYLVVLFIIPMI